MTAREWLAEADFDAMSEEVFQAFVSAVGYDKATECRAMMRRLAENLLDCLGNVTVSEQSMMRLMRTVSSIAVDNAFPGERNG